MNKKNLRVLLFCSLFLWSAQNYAAAEDDIVETAQETAVAENLLIETTAGKKCDFAITCKVSGKDLVFHYSTNGNVCNQSNPGQLSLVTKSKRFSLGLRGFSLKKVEDVGNSKQVCDIGGRKYPAKILKNNQIILFLRSEALPGYDKLGAVLIDTKENKVVTFTSNLGQIKNSSFALLNTKKGIKTRLVKEVVRGVRCDCDAAYIDDWKEIEVKNNLFKVKWLEAKK